MRLKNKNILIFGLGRSGKSVLNFLTGKGANIFLYDCNTELLNGFLNVYDANLYDTGCNKKMHFVVVSPGVKHSDEMLIYLKNKRFKIISEIEFAYRFCKGKICAITGTNGKTTCTNLVYKMLRNYNSNTYIAGNVGIPLTNIVANLNNESLVSLEISSFQMENIDKFRPRVATILNLASDHLDSYDTFDEYINAKFNIFRNQKKKDIAIINFDDKMLMQKLPKIKSTIKYFSTKQEVEGAYLQDENIFYKSKNKSEFICNIRLIKLKGMHNVSNVLACVCMAKALNIDNESIIYGIKDFKGLEHRLELIKNIEGIDYINDSKATNINSTLIALNALEGKNIHLLVGGSDKGENFEDLFRNIKINTKVYIYGATKQALVSGANCCDFNNYILCESMMDSCIKAKQNAHFGEIVLLSPACASFDEFKNYEERGNLFKRWVESLNENK